MSVRRLAGVPGFAIDEVAARAGSDPAVLRMENLDTDLPPPAAALAATRAVLGSDDANSYLPFTGQLDLCRAVAERLEATTGRPWDPRREVVITAGGTEGMLDALLATTDPGDEVILTDPTYAGMTNRVRIAGAVPRLVPFRWDGGAWRLDLDALRLAAGPRTRAVFLMNPSMPSGAVLDPDEWAAIAEVCARLDCLLLYNAAMERILFDGRAPFHPATLEPLRERTVVIGSVSKEYRMIGWRIGWVAAPAAILADIARVHLYNVVTPPGIAQAGAAAALRSGAEDVGLAVREWERRRDACCASSRACRRGPRPAAGPCCSMWPSWASTRSPRPRGCWSADGSRPPRCATGGKRTATGSFGWCSATNRSLASTAWAPGCAGRSPASCRCPAR